MSGDYSISLNGIFAAERNFMQASRRIAAENQPDPVEAVAIDQAKIAVKTNLQVISTQGQLDR